MLPVRIPSPLPALVVSTPFDASVFPVCAVTPVEELLEAAGVCVGEGAGDEESLATRRGVEGGSTGAIVKL
jgi:hypothetical protein